MYNSRIDSTVKLPIDEVDLIVIELWYMINCYHTRYEISQCIILHDDWFKIKSLFSLICQRIFHFNKII